MKPVLAFDLNGTITDTSALDPFFQEIFSSAERRREWFDQLIQLAMASTIAGYFEAFGKLSQAALQMVGERHDIVITQEQLGEMLGVGRSFINRSLRHFAANGVLASRRRRIVILDVERLGAIACGCNDRIREHFDTILAGVYPREPHSVAA